MTAMAVDLPAAGQDAAEIWPRYGGWFASRFVTVKGKETADGSRWPAAS
jgi:hypothetical protein